MKNDDYFRKLDQIDPSRLRVSPPPTPTDAWIAEWHQKNAPISECECDACNEARKADEWDDLCGCETCHEPNPKLVRR